MKICSDGYFVVCPSGRIGLAVDDKPHATRPKWTVITVQFGAGGPYQDYLQQALRYATVDEVKDVGLYGVGGQFGPPREKK
jgi:hypothetical protein